MRDGSGGERESERIPLRADQPLPSLSFSLGIDACRRRRGRVSSWSAAAPTISDFLAKRGSTRVQVSTRCSRDGSLRCPSSTAANAAPVGDVISFRFGPAKGTHRGGIFRRGTFRSNVRGHAAPLYNAPVAHLTRDPVVPSRLFKRVRSDAYVYSSPRVCERAYLPAASSRYACACTRACARAGADERVGVHEVVTSILVIQNAGDTGVLDRVPQDSANAVLD